mmetsp:Transcript_49282/g.157649  ORF Transcript_49282/g.157649 Transcript_49282/m.157649 type:complete len:224 (+) Transcript_49282:286-957(+)
MLRGTVSGTACCWWSGRTWEKLGGRMPSVIHPEESCSRCPGEPRQGAETWGKDLANVRLQPLPAGPPHGRQPTVAPPHEAGGLQGRERCLGFGGPAAPQAPSQALQTGTPCARSGPRCLPSSRSESSSSSQNLILLSGDAAARCSSNSSEGRSHVGTQAGLEGSEGTQGSRSALGPHSGLRSRLGVRGRHTSGPADSSGRRRARACLSGAACCESYISSRTRS